MKPLSRFLVIAVVFEVLALLLASFARVGWILAALIALFGLYLVFLAVRGWRRQVSIDYPEIMHGKVVRKRHWRMF